MKSRRKYILYQQSAFTLVELIVYMLILAVLMAVVLASFTATIRRTGQQSSIAETKIESSIGLDLLRTDLESGGFGLPWQFPSAPNPYTEPDPMADIGEIPKAFSSENASVNSPLNVLTGTTDSDYLTIRGTNVIRGIAGQKFAYVGRDASHNVDIQPLSTDLFANSDNVIVIRPVYGQAQYRQLIMNGTSYVYKPTTAGLNSIAPPPTPNDPDGERYMLYGINDGSSAPRRPFNRTDYYINTANVPAHCAQNTGVLVKATLNQADDNFSILPIVDCVADFQLVFYRDTDYDGGWDVRSDADGLDGLTAQEIRDQVQSVRCYILTHEGNADRDYIYPNATINVGDVDADGATGQLFDIANTIGADWANYRWKIESLAVTPVNLK